MQDKHRYSKIFFTFASTNIWGRLDLTAGRDEVQACGAPESGHLNIGFQKFNWRKQLRSRCLTEV